MMSEAIEHMINKRAMSYQYYPARRDAAGLGSIDESEVLSIKGFVDAVKRQPFTDEIRINFFSRCPVIGRRGYGD